MFLDLIIICKMNEQVHPSSEECKCVNAEQPIENSANRGPKMKLKLIRNRDWRAFERRKERYLNTLQFEVCERKKGIKMSNLNDFRYCSILSLSTSCEYSTVVQSPLLDYLPQSHSKFHQLSQTSHQFPTFSCQ